MFIPLWRRYIAELNRLVSLALPLVLAQLAQMSMGFVDTVMAGRYSPHDLAAVAIGSSIWVPVSLFVVGILLALTPIIAQDFGARNYRLIPHSLRQGLWLALFLGVVGTFLLHYFAWMLVFIGMDAELKLLTIAYLKAIAWGFVPLALFQVLRSFSEGLGFVRPVMLISFLGLIANIPANYILIYGKLGFPALGGEGCGWASAFVLWLMFISMAVWVIKGKAYSFLPPLLKWEWPDYKKAFNVVRLGLPIGVSIFIETSLFAVIALFIASLGAEVVAGHQIALNFTSLTFMLPLSFSMAITVRVGHAVGAGEFAAARFSAFAGPVTVAVIAFFSASFILLFSPSIAALYSPDPVVQAVAISLLFYAALLQVSDAVQISAIGGLRGYKDTTVPMLITVVSFWLIGLSVGYLLGLSQWAGFLLGAEGFWIGLVSGLSAAAVLQVARLYFVAKRW